jgi:hypothetical protein
VNGNENWKGVKELNLVYFNSIDEKSNGEK